MSSRDGDSVHASVFFPQRNRWRSVTFLEPVFAQQGWLLGSSVEHHSSQFRGPIHGVAANGLLFGTTDNQPSSRSSARDSQQTIPAGHLGLGDDVLCANGVQVLTGVEHFFGDDDIY